MHGLQERATVRCRLNVRSIKNFRAGLTCTCGACCPESALPLAQLHDLGLAFTEIAATAIPEKKGIEFQTPLALSTQTDRCPWWEGWSLVTLDIFEVSRWMPFTKTPGKTTQTLTGHLVALCASKSCPRSRHVTAAQARQYTAGGPQWHLLSRARMLRSLPSTLVSPQVCCRTCMMVDGIVGSPANGDICLKPLDGQ